MDCLEGLKLLSDNSVDLVVTSPPYNMRTRIRNGEYTTREKSEHFSKKYEHFSDDLTIEEYYDFHKNVLTELLRVSKCVLWNYQIVTGSKSAVFRLLGDFADQIKDIIKNAKIYESQKVVLIKILRSNQLTVDSRHALAKKLIEFEENKFTKTIEKTDVVTRIGPTLGLMGTLIPMGPGLAALGAGDVNTLANAIIVAFDTTVVGIGAGAVAYFVSKVRRRWYEEYLSNLDALADALLDKLNQIAFCLHLV